MRNICSTFYILLFIVLAVATISISSLENFLGKVGSPAFAQQLNIQKEGQGNNTKGQWTADIEYRNLVSSSPAYGVFRYVREDRFNGNFSFYVIGCKESDIEL